MASTNYLMDIDIYGRSNANGLPIELYDEDAVKNALTFFLTSKKGDILYNPDIGGYLDSTLFKNMSPDSLQKIVFSLRNSIIKYFTPTIILQGIDINPVYETRTLEFLINYYNPQSKTSNQLLIYTKNLVDISPDVIEEIVYEGENLYMFCLMKKPDMGKDSLTYNNELSSWCWGLKYKFTNLTIADTWFDAISTVCNS